MTAGFLQPGFAGWPPGAPTFSKLSSTLNLYVDPTSGNDDKPGTSRADAIKTAAKLADLIAFAPGSVDVHLKSGTLVLPDRGYFLRPRIISGNSVIRFFADETWDPAVYTVVGGNRTAEAATAATVVKATGLVVNALQDASMRFTSGAAAGQYRRIRNNTATDIIPNEAFDPAPAEGDTYQVFTNASIIKLPESTAAHGTSYKFVQDCVSVQSAPDDFWNLGRNGQFPPGLLLEGLDLQLDSDGRHVFSFGNCPVYLYGVAIANFALTFDGSIYSGWGLSDHLVKLGWGLQGMWAYRGPRSVFGGYINSTEAVSCRALDGITELWGGHAHQITVRDGGNITVNGDFSATIPFLTNVLNALTFGMLRTDLVEVIEGANAHHAGNLVISTNTTGAVPVSASGGSKILIGNACNLGGAGNDWTITGVAAFNKSFFAATGDFKFGTDGSLAERIGV